MCLILDSCKVCHCSSAWPFIDRLQAVYLAYAGSRPATVKYPLGAALTEYRTKLFMPARAYTSSVGSQGYNSTELRIEVPPGPYFMSPLTGDVFQAYRLIILGRPRLLHRWTQAKHRWHLFHFECCCPRSSKSHNRCAIKTSLRQNRYSAACGGQILLN